MVPSCVGRLPDRGAPLRILHVSPSFYPAHVYGGPIQSTFHLCRQLAADGHDVRVITTNASGPNEVLDVDTRGEVEVAEGVRVRYFRRVFSENASVELLRALPSAVSAADVVHLTGVYSFPTFPALLACRSSGRPLVWSPRGSLQRHPGTTRLVMKAMWEAVCIGLRPSRLCLHVTSEMEAKESAARFPDVPRVVISNGVDVPPPRRKRPAEGCLRVLFLGRVHPIKGIENLIAACAELTREPGPTWHLTVAGAGIPSYGESLRGLADKLGVAEQVTWAGEVLGEAKEALFDTHDVAVLPSLRENFGMVVAEALSRGVPVIASRGTPWEGLEREGCGLWVANDALTLASALRRIAASSLDRMGEKGRLWMQRDFSWSAVARRMAALYQDLAGRA